MPTPPANDGRKTVGRYVLAARLGAGAFGTVYKAYDPELKRQVALKVPNPGVLANPTKAERFLREAQAAAGLRHANIVPVYDAGKDGDQYFIASAFIDGQPLSDAIPEAGVEAGRAADLVRQLAGAVAYAHKHKIVHRDIKPANVLLDADGVPHLADFGLAARADGDASKLTNDGAVLGTPSYMAPEQAAGQRGEANPASDQYALGVVLYELLTGRTPFEGPPASVIYSAIHAAAPPPRSIRPDIPPELEQICLRALAKKPTARFPDCQALADKLERWQRDLTVSALGPGPARRRWWPWVAGGAGVAAAVMAAVALSGRPAAAPGVPPDEPAAPPPTPPAVAVAAPPESRVATLSGSATWRREGDVLIVQTARRGAITFGSPAWKDYDFTAEVRSDAAAGGFGLRAREAASGAHFEFVILPTTARATSFWNRPQPGGKEAPIELEAGRWYGVSVIARGNEFQCNMTEIGKSKKRARVSLTYTDPQYPIGPVGFFAGGPNSPAAEFRFRNPRVTAADGKVLWEGLPELPKAP